MALIYVKVMKIFAYYGIVVFLIGTTFEVIEVAKKKRLWFLIDYLLETWNKNKQHGKDNENFSRPIASNGASN